MKERKNPMVEENKCLERNDPDFKALLDEHDPIDRLVLELAQEGKLRVGMVELRGNRWHFLRKFVPRFISH